MKTDVEIRNMLNEIRSLRNGNLLVEENNDNNTQEKTDGVPYTMQDELMSSITNTCKTQFGADFSASDKPMQYFPADGDVILSGTITTLNDTKFQFRYKDANGGCYVWCNPLLLNDDNVKTISIIYGVYKNWKQELSGVEDIKPMSLKDENPNPSSTTNVMVPGDDF